MPANSAAQALRIVFAGTPDFAASHLQTLLDANYNVVAVYTQPDRPAGRGKKLMASPVKEVALAAGIEVLQPLNFKEQADRAALAALKPDLMIVVAYGLLLPQAVLDIPRLGCINVHGSLLPRWRGAAPIQRAIEAGDAQTGVGIMQMEAGLDTGPVLLEAALPIEPADNGQTVHDKLAALGCQTLLEALPLIAEGKAQPAVQAEDGVTYAHKLSKDDARLDFSQSAQALHNKIRAFNPFPVAWCELPDGGRLRVWVAELADRSGPAGQVLAVDGSGILIACGNGSLNLTEVQLPDKRRMHVKDLLNGNALKLSAGEQLS